MLGSNAARTVLTVLLAALVLLGGIRLWQVYVLAVLFGTVDALFYPAFDAFPPLILDEERLGSGNALLQGTDQGSSLLGPALAGVLIAAVGGSRGIGIAFAIDALSFAFATVALLLMRGGNRTAASTEVTDVPGRQARRLMRDIAAGLIYAWKDPILRILVIVAAAASVAINSPLSVGLATLAHSRFSGGAAAFGLMFTVLGVGGLAGTIAAGMIQRPRHRGLTIIGILLAFSVGMIAIALLPNLLIVCAILGALGITNGLVGVLLATWLQIRTAQDMLGRVMSILTFGQFGLAPLSLAVAGLLAQQSVTLLLVAAGLLMAAIALAAAASPTLRTFD
jgi:MFS family permease